MAQLRTGDTIYNVLDQYTGESVTYNRVNETTATIDGVMFINVDGEVFKRSFNGPLNVKWWGVKGDGVTDDAANIQLAANYVVKYGGHLYFPKGVYVVNASYITFAGGSNIKVTGDGMGATVIQRAITGHYTAKAGERNQEVGLFKVDAITSGAYVKNFVFEGMSFKRDNYVAPWTSGPNENRHQHNFFFGKVKQIVFEKCEFDGSSSEMLYWNGGVSDTAEDITINGCVFRNGQMSEPQYGASSMLNSNTVHSKNVKITNNTFVNGGTGVLILGENLQVTGNNFKDVAYTCINVAETNVGDISIKGAIIANNNIVGLGKGLTSVSLVTGIIVKSRAGLATNFDYDDAVSISNNNIIDTYMGAGHQLYGIAAEGSCRISGNYLSKITLVNGNTSNSSMAINTASTTGEPGSDKRIYIENNIVEHNSLTGSPDAGWFIGVNLTNTDITGGIKNATYFLSNNSIIAPLPFYMQPPVSGQPVATVYSNNNYCKGGVVLRGTWGDNGIDIEGIFSGNNKALLIVNGVIYNPNTGQFEQNVSTAGAQDIIGLKTFKSNPVVSTAHASTTYNSTASGDNGIEFSDPLSHWKIGQSIGGAPDGSFNLFDFNTFTSPVIIKANHEVLFEKKVSGLAGTADGDFIIKSQLDAKKAAVNADVVSADATDLPTAITLINELKVTVNALQTKMRAAGLLTT